MSVKGQEFPAYDSRGIQGMGLTYATANRGACHLRAYTVSSEILGVPEKTDPHVTDGKAGLVKAFQDATSAVDSSGLCVFTTFAWSLDDIAPQINAACEGDWTAEKLLEVGERVWNLERQYNCAAGFTGARTTTCPRVCSRTRRRLARPRASPTASPRCCRSTTRCAAGPTRACPATRRWSASRSSSYRSSFS